MSSPCLRSKKIGGGWFYFEEQKEIVDELKVELSQKNESELLKSEFEKLALEKENLESQFLTLEKAFQELERKNASGSNQNNSQKSNDEVAPPGLVRQMSFGTLKFN